MNRLIASLTLAASLAALNMPAHAQSFSCMDGRLNAAERTICDHGGLGALDERLDSWYRRALVRAGYFQQTAEIRGDQKAWLASRNACGSGVWCLRRAYRSRIRELRNYVEHV